MGIIEKISDDIWKYGIEGALFPAIIFVLVLSVLALTLYAYKMEEN
jgi:hypothetical protein